MKREKIIIYGFDKLGFGIPSEPVSRNGLEFEFLQSTELDGAWESADGLILLSNTFEEHYKDNLGYFRANYNSKNLPVIEKHIYNLISKGKWVCFLLVNKLIKNTLKDGNIIHYELAKKILYNFGIDWENYDASEPVLTWKFDEFKPFITKFGIRQTSFYNPDHNPNVTVISGFETEMYAFDLFNKIFFLPFKPISNRGKDIIEMGVIVSKSIKEYRYKQQKVIPEWTKEFQFEKEKSLNLEIKKILKLLESKQTELDNITQYKLLLTTSGENLCEIGIKVLKESFGYQVDPIDNGHQDATIISDEGVLAFIEFKGTNKGIKRENINQVDSHRERSKLSPSTPGILIINTKMKSESIDQKIEEKIADEHIFHAQNLNITIIRTIDLLQLIKFNENKNNFVSLLDLAKRGGGLLQWENDKIELKQINGNL